MHWLFFFQIYFDTDRDIYTKIRHRNNDNGDDHSGDNYENKTQSKHTSMNCTMDKTSISKHEN